MQTRENEVVASVHQILDQVRRVIVGKDEALLWVLAALLAKGHILLEDVPGVGKTTMALSFARALDLEYGRIQFTPDVLPSDVTGYSVPDGTGNMVYRPGGILCNLFLADEINRTSPKTQSALLEVMEEGKVTVDGVSREVPKPFIVMATQNPKGSAGTQLLPESQLDRFMICMSMGYPDVKSEIAIARGRSSSANMVELQPVIGAQELEALCGIVEDVYMSESIYTYIVALVGKTRENSYIELGVSPRGTIACVRMAKAWAFLQGRNYVMPEDVADIFIDIVKHRIVLNTKARVTHMTEEAILSEILSVTKQPASYMEKSEYRG